MDDLEQLLAYELTTGETLLWSGRPRKGFMLQRSDAYVIPFMLVWGFFVLFVSQDPGELEKGLRFFDLHNPALTIFVALLLVCLVVGRFVVDARRRRRTIYGVTSSRVIILTKLSQKSVQSLRLRNLSEVSLSERTDSSGDIVLVSAGPADSSKTPGSPAARRYGSPTLRGISQAQQVYDLICRARSEDRQPDPRTPQATIQEASHE